MSALVDIPNKILFLDVDGVLNTQTCVARDAIHPKLLKRLGQVIAFSGAFVVLSSTWRLHPNYRALLLERLASVGVTEVSTRELDTPQLPMEFNSHWPPGEANRAAEICAWVDVHAPKRKIVWAAVDDLDVMQSPRAADLHGHFVRTSNESGLTQKCADQLCKILGPRSINGI